MIDSSRGMPADAAEAQTWERECVEALRVRATQLRGKRQQPEIETVTLERGFPDTELRVAYSTRSTRQPLARSYSLWKAPFLTPFGRETPYEVALIIHSDIQGSSA